MTMTDMFNATLAHRAELRAADPEREILMCEKTFEINGVGKVWCGVQIAPAGAPFMGPHYRRHWKLNGEYINPISLARLVGT